jgi:hypothetical protein
MLLPQFQRDRIEALEQVWKTAWDTLIDSQFIQHRWFLPWREKHASSFAEEQDRLRRVASGVSPFCVRMT